MFIIEVGFTDLIVKRDQNSVRILISVLNRFDYGFHIEIFNYRTRQV